MREKYIHLMESKDSEPTETRSFTFAEVADILKFCNKLNTTNIELDKMVVNERQAEDESDTNQTVTDMILDRGSVNVFG